MGQIKGRFCQLHLAFAGCFSQVVSSLLSVWPSYTCSLLESNATPLSAPMTKTEESLLGSLPSLGAMVGTVMVGTIIDRLGRKNGGVLLSLPYVISWTMISATSSIKVILAARFLSGIAAGGSLVYAPIFISEVAEDSFRGTLASGVTLMYCFGILLSYIFGWIFSYRAIIYTNLVFSVVCTLLIVSVKESPVYLLKQKRFEEARASLAHYRGCSPSSTTVNDEFQKLKRQILPAKHLLLTADKKSYGTLRECTSSFLIRKETNAEEPSKEKLNLESEEAQTQTKMSPLKLLFLSQPSRRAFCVVHAVMSMQVLMGIVPVQVYAESVFRQTDPDRTDLYSVIFALVLTCGSLVPTVVADRVGRRILLISSSILVCICLIVLGYLLQHQAGPPWLTILVIMLYCFSIMYGASSVPYVLLAEVFISEVQNLASIIIVEWVWFFNFVIIAVFPYMNSYFGLHGTFYCYAFVSISNAVIVYFMLPETKGLSNEQIQNAFMGRKKE